MRKKRLLITVCTVCLMMFAPLGQAQIVQEKPSAMAMTADFVIVRPVMLVATILGSGLFVATLPFSAAGGNIGQAADTLVVTPAMSTFVRCLGCTQPGYAKSVR